MIDPDEEHCGNDCGGVYDEESGDHLDAEECVCCECCCDCLGCIYAPQDSVPLTAEQRAPIAEMTFGAADIPPNAGSAS